MSVKFVSLDNYHAYGFCELSADGQDFESQIKTVISDTVFNFAHEKGYTQEEASFMYVFDPTISDQILNLECDFLSVNETHFSVECYVYRKLSNILLAKSFHVFVKEK